MKKLEESFNTLISEIQSRRPGADIKIIKKAWEFAKASHAEQKRLSGEPFVSHLLEVATILFNWNLDTVSIVAGILHDSVEDGAATREDLVKEFGEDVAFLVDGVTKITELRLKGSTEENFVENLRKMFFAMAKDLRVVLIKLADRLHNMKTISALSPERQKENARETIEIYAPLAQRLGMGRIKGELEDLSFPCVYPGEYKDLVKKTSDKYLKAESHIKEMKELLAKETKKEGIQAEIHGRKKHYYSLWKKLQRSEIDNNIEKVYDLVALRILVRSIPSCYTSLGIVHKFYKPVPHLGISDFIAQPKPNGYRSIHTKVFGPEGRIVEVQIRTFEMHKEAELGVAAHWFYSETKSKKVDDEKLQQGKFVLANKLNWVRQLARWQEEIADEKEFLKAVKFDALKNRNYVFSPKGDVYDLPVGATPVDFAFAVHTDLGFSIAGAKVDQKMVPLNYRLESGQVVEIIKSKNPRRPSPNWLDFVMTTTARREISKKIVNR